MIGRRVIPSIVTAAGSCPWRKGCAVHVEVTSNLWSLSQVQLKNHFSHPLCPVLKTSQSQGVKNMNCDFTWCLGVLKSQWINSCFCFGPEFLLFGIKEITLI